VSCLLPHQAAAVTGLALAFRVACQFQGKAGYVALDQIRTVDRARLVRKLGRLSSPALENSLRVLEEVFAP
jgi:mRNA interferase MazF